MARSNNMLGRLLQVRSSSFKRHSSATSSARVFSINDEAATTSGASASDYQYLHLSGYIKSSIFNILNPGYISDAKLAQQRIDDSVKLMDACSALTQVLDDLQQYVRGVQRSLNNFNIPNSKPSLARVNMIRARNALRRLPAPALIISAHNVKKQQSTPFSILSKLTAASGSGAQMKNPRVSAATNVPLLQDLLSLHLSVNQISAALDAALSGDGDTQIYSSGLDNLVGSAFAGAKRVLTYTAALQLKIDTLFSFLRDSLNQHRN